MEGRWGRRVYGRIQKGPKYTRFYLSMVMHNNLTIERQMILSNVQLERFEGAYKFTLDQMTEELDAQLKRNIYTS